MSRDTSPRQILFDPTPEIFATDSGGGFVFPLLNGSEEWIETAPYDEARFIFSLWTPAANAVIDLDRVYAELRGAFNPEEERWIRLEQLVPIVPPYGGDSFDGWLELPVLGARCSFALYGSGFEPRTRLQIRASIYMVP